MNYVGDALLDTTSSCSNVYSLVLVEAVCTFAYQRLRACMAFGMSDALPCVRVCIALVYAYIQVRATVASL
jgi:hypothetical protein